MNKVIFQEPLSRTSMPFVNNAIFPRALYWLTSMTSWELQPWIQLLHAN